MRLKQFSVGFPGLGAMRRNARIVPGLGGGARVLKGLVDIANGVIYRYEVRALKHALSLVQPAAAS